MASNIIKENEIVEDLKKFKSSHIILWKVSVTCVCVYIYILAGWNKMCFLLWL